MDLQLYTHLSISKRQTMRDHAGMPPSCKTEKQRETERNSLRSEEIRWKSARWFKTARAVLPSLAPNSVDSRSCAKSVLNRFQSGPWPLSPVPWPWPFFLRGGCIWATKQSRSCHICVFLFHQFFSFGKNGWLDSDKTMAISIVVTSKNIDNDNDDRTHIFE